MRGRLTFTVHAWMQSVHSNLMLRSLSSAREDLVVEVLPEYMPREAIKTSYSRD